MVTQWPGVEMGAATDFQKFFGDAKCVDRDVLKCRV